MNAAPAQLRAFVERIERVNEERKALSDDVSDIYKEAKANGYDTKALKIVIQRRAKDSDALSELDAIVETYETALGTRPALTRARATPSARPDPTIKSDPVQSSDGGVEGHAAATGLPVANEHRGAKACSGALERSLDRSGANPKGGAVAPDTRQPAAGVEPCPSEAITPSSPQTPSGDVDRPRPEGTPGGATAFEVIPPFLKRDGNNQLPGRA